MVEKLGTMKVDLEVVCSTTFVEESGGVTAVTFSQQQVCKFVVIIYRAFNHVFN